MELEARLLLSGIALQESARGTRNFPPGSADSDQWSSNLRTGGSPRAPTEQPANPSDILIHSAGEEPGQITQVRKAMMPLQWPHPVVLSFLGPSTRQFTRPTH